MKTRNFNIEKLKVGDYVSTRNGKKAKIKSINLDSEFPIYAIIDCELYSDYMLFDKNGVYKYGNHRFDLCM